MSIPGRALQAWHTHNDMERFAIRNVPTLSSVSRILLLLISGEKAEKGTPLYGLYGDVPLDRVLFVRRPEFNSPVESVKRQTDPYGKAMKK